MPKKQSLTRRSLHYYWLATRNHLGLFVALVASTIGFCGFLTYGNPYVMSLIVDRIAAEPVAADQVFAVFGPYIAALIGINVAGQACSKLQDYTLWKLQIAVNYDLATMAFDCLCNQSLSFHSNRFGGTLVSQTSKFMAGYTQLLQTMNFPFLPILCSITFTCLIICLYRVSLSLSCHLIALKIFIISCDLIDQLTARNNLHDTVRCCLYDLVVSGSKEKYSRELDQTIVECCDRLHIQVVCWLIKKQYICS